LKNEPKMEKEKKLAFFIDDDQGFVELIPLMVKHPRFEIKSHCTTNGYQVVDEVVKTRPDVLFIDFNLPRANGSQLVPILKSIDTLSSMRIYFLTAYTEDQIRPFVKDLEFDGILYKMEELNSKITKIFDDLDHSLAA
jgi:two-component SAPR family response regulator